ncbi:hypothetical protein [Rhodococcus sp. 3-2]|uniref:hypothetical protein n=1 Tax=Rhodococcus sp. 3-2 TaxID=2890836 RepID=UPI001D194638|nr:hypothetical protein [Rhodococcus sp. 3-2]MCC4300403.1 hypothetical protein [Rhodococcus sp. 3-2]MCC4300463.1 hypothetical protein [Rhodococcus sp. 3-2]
MSEIRSQDTPARDELVHILAGAVLDNPGGIGTLPQHAADQIIAAGWLKPRTVNSAAELDALKPGTVLRFPDGEIGMIMVTHDKRHVIGYPGILPTAELADASQHCFGDGITVLFTPGEAG